jgi:Holliday junction resolvasome RuvABC endonuclease subunit
VFGVNAKASIDQAYVVGAIRSTLILHGVNHSLVDNTTWKKQILGSGKASKEEIEMFARDVLNLPEGLTQDLYDAACISQFGTMAAQGRR